MKKSSIASALLIIIHVSLAGFGQIAEWRFDEASGQDVLDTSGNNIHGTLGASTRVEPRDPAWTSGIVGGCLYFDGIDDFVSINPSDLLNNLDAFTLEAWVNPTSYTVGTSETGMIFDKDDSTKRLMLDFSSRGLYGQVRFTGNSATSRTVERVPLNEWSYVVMTLDTNVDDYVRLYINGQEATYLEQTAGIGIPRQETRLTTSGWLIGCRNRQIRFFNGKIDEVRIHDKALSPTEILERYTALLPQRPTPTPRTASMALVGEWKFDEESGQDVLDTSGNDIHGTLGATSNVESRDPVRTTGRVGGALQFDGINDYISITPSFSLNDLVTFTLEAWIYPSSYTDRTGEANEIFDKGDSLKRFMFDFDGSGGLLGQVRFTGNSATSRTWEIVPLNQWTHVAMTLDMTVDNNVRIYINGREATYFEQTEGIGWPEWEAGVAPQGWLIGCRNRRFRFFDGKIDEARIYDKALSPAEIHERYIAAIPAQPTPTPSQAPGTTLVGEWKFDEGADQDVFDTSGNNNHGTLGANASAELIDPVWTTGKVGGALRFDGIDDYVAIAPSDSLSDLPAFTLEAWIYPASHADSAGDPSEIFDKGDSSKRFMFDFDGSGGLMGQVRFSGNSAESHSWEIIPLNEWTHVVMSLDTNVDTTIRLYINGQESNYYSQIAGIGRMNRDVRATTLGWLIGCRNRRYRSFEGKIDEVRIYSKALTPSEVRERYNIGLTSVSSWEILW